MTLTGLNSFGHSEPRLRRSPDISPVGGRGLLAEHARYSPALKALNAGHPELTTAGADRVTVECDAARGGQKRDHCGYLARRDVPADRDRRAEIAFNLPRSRWRPKIAAALVSRMVVACSALTARLM